MSTAQASADCPNRYPDFAQPTQPPWITVTSVNPISMRASPLLTQINASGRRISESSFARRTFRRFEGAPMTTDCSTNLFGFTEVEGCEVVAAFDGGAITSDAGALLPGAADRAIGRRHVRLRFSRAEQALQASWSPAILASVVEKGECARQHRGPPAPRCCSYGGVFISPCWHATTHQVPQRHPG
jgi:hypothetical protein